MEYKDLISGLRDVYGKLNYIGDLINSLVKLTNDVEIKASIMSLSESAYNLAVEVQDVAETYMELEKSENLENDVVIDNLSDEELLPADRDSDEEELEFNLNPLE